MQVRILSGGPVQFRQEGAPLVTIYHSEYAGLLINSLHHFTLTTMSSLLQRLSLMAGVTLTESQMQPKIQMIYIKLFDVGLEDQPDDIVNEFVAKAVEAQDVLTVDDWRINHDTLQLEFVPMLRSGEVTIGIAKEFRDYMIDFLSDPENMETYDESVQEATGSNKVFDDYNAWKGAVEKAGLEVFSDGAADGKYTAKKDGEVYGRFNKDGSGGWLHSSVIGEAAIGEPWTVHLKFRKKGEERTWSSANHKLNAPDKERAKSYAIADFKKKGYVDVSAVRATLVKAVKEDANYDDEGNVIPEGPLPQGLAEIARKMGFETLETQNSDSLDFKDVAVWSVKAALLAAYNLGKTQATAQATPAEQQPQSGGLPPPESRTPADHQQAGPTGIAR